MEACRGGFETRPYPDNTDDRLQIQRRSCGWGPDAQPGLTENRRCSTISIEHYAGWIPCGSQGPKMPKMKKHAGRQDRIWAPALAAGFLAFYFLYRPAADSDAARLSGTGAGVLLRLAFRAGLPDLSRRDQRTVFPVLSRILLLSLDRRGGHDSALRGHHVAFPAGDTNAPSERGVPLFVLGSVHFPHRAAQRLHLPGGSEPGGAVGRVRRIRLYPAGVPASGRRAPRCSACSRRHCITSRPDRHSSSR